jgi:hypothetical protein
MDQQDEHGGYSSPAGVFSIWSIASSGRRTLRDTSFNPISFTGVRRAELANLEATDPCSRGKTAGTRS